MTRLFLEIKNITLCAEPSLFILLYFLCENLLFLCAEHHYPCRCPKDVWSDARCISWLAPGTWWRCTRPPGCTTRGGARPRHSRWWSGRRARAGVVSRCWWLWWVGRLRYTLGFSSRSWRRADCKWRPSESCAWRGCQGHSRKSSHNWEYLK